MGVYTVTASVASPRNVRFGLYCGSLSSRACGKRAVTADKCDGGLQPRQRRAEAEVRTLAKPQVPDRFPVGVELAGPVERGRVVVRGGQQQHHGVALDHGGVANCHVVSGNSAHQLDRWVVTQRLLHDGGYPRRVGAQRRPLPRVTQHRQDRIGDQIHRGLMPGDQQQIARRDDLFLGELVPGFLDVDQPRHEVVTGIGAAPTEQIPEVPA